MPRLDMHAAGTAARYGSAVVGSAAGPAGGEDGGHLAEQEAAGGRDQDHAGGDPGRDQSRPGGGDRPEDGTADRFPH